MEKYEFFIQDGVKYARMERGGGDCYIIVRDGVKYLLNLGSQDTFYVGTIKGVGRIYQQTFVDTYSKVVI